MRPVRSHIFRGKRYKIEETNVIAHDAGGTCDWPGAKGKKIKLRKGLPPRVHLENAVHEALHAALWDLDEAVVEEVGVNIAAFLWRLGYRRVSE